MNEYVLQLQALANEANLLARRLGESKDTLPPALRIQELFNLRVQLETLNRRLHAPNNLPTSRA